MGNKELTRLKQYCVTADLQEKQFLLKCCTDVDEAIADDLYCTLVTNVSYDLYTNHMRYIPCGRSLFYRCRDKVILMFRDYLIEKGKWE